jgi:hypothetical protein
MTRWALLSSAAFLWGATSAPAQSPTTSVIRGVLLNGADRRPIEGGRITLVGTAHAATTGARGEFELAGLGPGRYVIRAAAIGFASLTSPIDLKENFILDVEFETQPEAVKLPEITVEEQANHGPMDWLRRRTEGRGRYITRTEIERRNAATLPDVLRMLPGVRIECRGSSVCFVRMTRAPRGCSPAFFMDGIPSDPAIAYLTPLQEVEGVEVYSGPAETPPELESQRARCGVVVIWTRTPPPRRPKEPKVPKPKPDTTRS